MHLDIALPVHVPEQIALYQSNHLLTHDVCRFDPVRAAGKLQTTREVMAIDIGGDKIRGAIFRTGNGILTKLDERSLQSRGGAGYLSFLQQLAEEARAGALAVGISSATKLDGSTIRRTVNLPLFFDEFRQEYDADYRKLFGERLFVANDTITGICGSSMHLARRGKEIRDVAFFICASGLGASVLRNETAIHVEVAHVPLIDSLNPLGQTAPCGVEGREYVCVERVTAARAGIEDLYFKQTGEAKNGLTLGKMYEEDDALATVLYETSALALSHAAVGVMDRYAFSNSNRSAVIFHGGNLEIAKYREGLRRNLGRLPGSHSQIIFSRDLSENVCLDGAAVLSVYHPT